MFYKKVVLRNFAKFTGKRLCQSVLFNKLLKKKLWHRCFLVNFMNFVRTSFIIEHLWWLLMSFHLVHGRNLFKTPLYHTILNYQAKLPLRKECPYSEFSKFECGKIRTRATSNIDIFYAVFLCHRLLSNSGYTIVPYVTISGATIYLHRKYLPSAA